MRRLVTGVCCAIFALGGCSSSTGPEKDTGGSQTGDVFASAAIGGDGGTVASDAVSVVVPPGAFGADATVTISESSEQPLTGEDAPVYTIGGIPADFTEPVTVRIPFDGEPPEYPVIALGEEVFPRSGDATQTTWRLVDAEAADGVLECDIPPIPAEAAAKSAATTDDPPLLLHISGPIQYRPVVTAGGHFRIAYPYGSVTTAQATQLGEALEDAWNVIQSMGYSYTARTSWPVEVTVKTLASGADGLTTCSIWGDNYSYLEFNTAIMNDAAHIRATAIHEFFHLVQSFYDPRWAYTQAKFRSPTLWLDEATAVWIEEKLAENPAAYQPGTLFNGNFMEPLAGAAKRETARMEQNYGYGMAAMIDYLTGRYGDDCVRQMYERIKGGADPVPAVEAVTEPYLEWWEEFMRSYVSGGIYGRGFQHFIGGNSGQFTVLAETDSVEMFSADFADLSAKVYVVKFGDPYLPGASVLECGVSGGMSEVSAFTYDKNGAITFIDTATDKVTVPDIKTISDSTGSGVLVLVTNCRAISPYDQESQVTLTLRVNRPEPAANYTSFSFSPQFYGLFTDSRGMSYSDIISGPPFSSFGSGSMAGNTFSAEWNRSDGASTTTGSIIIIFNEDRTVIESFSGEFSREFPLSNEKHTGTIAGGPVPLTESSGGTATYSVQGSAVCNAVAVMHYRGETTNSGFWRESNALDCEKTGYRSLYFTLE